MSAAAFRYIAPSAADLPALAGALSRAIFDDNGGTPYMTAILCQIDPAKGELRYLNAGHPAGRLAGPGRLVRLESTGPLLGGECPLSRAEEELRHCEGKECCR